MKNLEKLTKIITDELPEILELKFGCVIKFNDDLIGKDIFIKKDRDENIYTRDDLYGFKFEQAEFKIIGRPITNNDILILLGKYNSRIEKKTLSLRFYYPHSLQIEREGKLLCVINLKEDLNGQKQKTIDFLYNLLK